MGPRFATLMHHLHQYPNVGEGPTGDASGEKHELALLVNSNASAQGGAQDSQPMEAQTKACLARLAFGALLERLACTLWNNTARLDRRARLMYISSMVAWWTSMHVEHALLMRDGNKYNVEPNIMNVPTQGNECALDHMIDEKVVCGSSCRGTSILHQMLIRCTNPASRGWTTTVHTVISQESGCSVILRHALIVCLTGMHANLQPTDRPDWHTRARTLWRMQRSMDQTQFAAFVSRHSNVAKEAIRRRLVETLESSPALRHIMSKCGSVMATIGSPPRAFPSNASHKSMTHMVNAGRANASDEHATLDVAIDVEFDQHGNTLDWLNKVLIKHSSESFLSEASRVFISSFAAHWNSFWVFVSQYNERPMRLDKCQYDAISSVDPAMRLCNAIDTRISLRVQRYVLQNPVLGALTSDDVHRLLKIPESQRMSLLSTIRHGDALTSAVLLDMVRTTWLCEQLLVVDLGHQARCAQIISLIEKHKHHVELNTLEKPSDAGLSKEQLNNVIAKLPVACTNLCLCPECKRVANATPPLQVNHPNCLAFDEVGTPSTMLSTKDITSSERSVDLHCAKRSSAALRSAISAEQHATAVMVDAVGTWDECSCSDMVQKVMRPATVTSMRRDGRRAQEQRREALACGDTPLVLIPLIGRVVRIHGTWYGMCSMCCNITRVLHFNRIGADIVCATCFAKRMVETIKTEDMPNASLYRDQRCRFCSKAVPADRGNFISYASPNDTFGSNRLLPRNLRVTWWCQMHRRNWLANALHVLETHVILTHISMRAKPIYLMDSANDKASPHETLAIEHRVNEEDVHDNADANKAQKAKRRRFNRSLANSTRIHNS